MKKISLFALLGAFTLPQEGHPIAGAFFRDEHCTGVCDIVEYNCDLKDQAKITPSDMLVRDKGKLPRKKTKGYSPQQMRDFCMKSCFHKDPWKKHKANPSQYFQDLCRPTGAVAKAEAQLQKEDALYMQPFVPEAKSFSYKVQSHSNQITPLNIKVLDRNFIVTTGGGIARAVGSVELMVLVLASLKGTAVERMNEDQKHKLARDLMAKELSFSPKDQKEYLEKGTTSVDSLAKVLEKVRSELYKQKGINPAKISVN
ncbi:MAG: hypothetical protein ACK5O7_04615 [Holosporales bacterium]